ncbi:MAG: NHL repeat-containing protein [Thermoplasmata archaeon]|nr:NHL repeat-containing protein [Thermoplasmata archaeon]
MVRPLVLGVVVGIAVLLVLSLPVPSSHGPMASVSPGADTALSPATIAPLAPNPFSTGMAASIALGAPNLSTIWPGPANASTFGGYPEYANLDSAGDIWVTDFGASRVVEFTPPFTTGEAASIVLGQSTFTGSAAGVSATNLTQPAACTFDSHGDLWVSDFGNNRILEYLPPFTSGMAASVVLGQSSFVGNLPGSSAINLTAPVGLAFDAQGNLWTADRSNNRVLEFTPPFATGMAASVVLGQSNFTGNQAGLTQTNLTDPLDVAVGSGVVWVADESDGRVLGYSSPFATGESASIVLGQTSFTTNSATGAASLISPLSVSSDPTGNLWVSDSQQNRVVEFRPPFSDFETPSIAIGQSNLLGTAAGLSPTNLSVPFGAVVAPSGDLWVTDPGNNRLLEYIPTPFGVTLRETGLPAGTSWSGTVGDQTVSGSGSLSFPPVTNGTYWVSIHPVAGYDANPSYTSLAVNGTSATLLIQFSAIPPLPFSSGMPASVVLGQPNFYTDEYPPHGLGNASGLSGTNYAAAFDSHGNLWVADADLNRVLEFVPPFVNGMAAALVLGQTTFHGVMGGTASTNLSFPDGLAFDSAGNLWVADASNNRIVEFASPFTDGESASVVIGQASFTATTHGDGPANVSDPAALTFYNGSLWLADYGNARVLQYPAPFSTGESASLALGQSSLTGGTSGTTAVNLSNPAWVAFDGHGNAWVADEENNRALEFPAPLTTGEVASVVLGQPNFTSHSSPLPGGLYADNGIAVDSRGNVWVADSGNNRVVEFAGPTFSTYQAPVLALGQGNTSTNFGSLGPSGLQYPTAILQDSRGNLWVVDGDNYRVLGYVPASYALTFSAPGLAAGTTWSVVVNGTTYPATGSSVSRTEQNGSYSWSVPSISGYTVTPTSGTSVVNGAGVTVVLTAVAPASYSITFDAKGLTSTTSWSVTIGTKTLTSTTGGPIAFSEPNGSYSYTVGAVSGYNISVNGTGVVAVSGTSHVVQVVFASTSNPSQPSGGLAGLSSTLLILILVVVLIAIAVAVLLMRRSKGGTPPKAGAPPPSAASVPTTSAPPPPPAGGGPPPGAMV